MPLTGLKDWFTAEGIPNVVELDWWEQITLVRKKGDVVDVKKKSELAVVTNSKRGNDEKEEYLYKVTFTPTQHWSNRGLFDRNISLWVQSCCHRRPAFKYLNRSYAGIVCG